MKYLITSVVLMAAANISCFGQFSQSLVQRAENGSVAAQMELAKCYRDGNGVDESPSDAVKWFEKAAEKGNVDAMVACAELYCSEWNFDMEPDYVKGIKWYRKAAAKGNKKAKEFLSDFDSTYEVAKFDGDIIDCPYEWLPCLSDFERLDLLKANRNKIEQEYRNNSPVAAYYLSILAFDNKNYTDAVKYLTKIYPLVMDENNYYDDILEQGESNGYLEATLAARVFSLLGWCYEYGLGVDKDFVKAAEYYLSDFDYSAFGMSTTPRVRGVYCYKKAKQFDKFIKGINDNGLMISENTYYYVPWLQLQLAEMYMTGDGVAQDKKKALGIYESIVDQRKDLVAATFGGWYPEYKSYSSIGEAAHRASLMYRNGDGCKADVDMAELYSEIAIKFGNQSAWHDKQNK